MDEKPPRLWPRPHYGWFALGSLLAVTLLVALAEAFLRLSPPRDLHPYLGDQGPLAGIYRPDPDFAVTYRSWEAFAADNEKRLASYLPFRDPADGYRTWAFFGNSFVQAPGMLADTARQALPERVVFNLGKNEPLYLRFAQVKLLLEHGLKPERLFVELMPTDVIPLGEQPLATLRVNQRGALTYAPRPPGGPLDAVVDNSRFALTAWARTGMHRGHPFFNRRTLYQGLEEPLLGDVRRLFGNLAHVAEQHRVPVTVLLIPAYHQICCGASFGFQDTVGAIFREQGFDVFDPRAAFCNQPDPKSLFIPDLHFNARGNQILLAELLAHIRAQEANRP